ncbi:MAG: nitroreductase [Parasphingorhabdus sp.]|jgi:nitroreductase
MTDKFTHGFESRYGELPQFDSPDNDEVISGLLEHRCHRDFTQEPVANSVMQSLFAAAFSAPSKSDLQQASVIRLTDSAIRKELVTANPAIQRLAKAPEFLIWCGDGRRIRLLTEERSKNFANEHLDAFMNAAVDAGIVMQNFIVAAESVGLGCCPVSQVRDNIFHLSKTLNLPRWVFPVAGLAVGWPAQPGKVSMRLPNRVTVHENQYDDTNMLADVNEYDARREASRPTVTDAQLHKDRYGVIENYGWSEHHSRQYSLPMRSDFGEYIRGQGFNLS